MGDKSDRNKGGFSGLPTSVTLRSGAKKLKITKTITEPDLGEQSDVMSENIYESLEDDVDDSEDEYQTQGRRKKPVKKSQNAAKSGSTQMPKNSEGPKLPPITVTHGSLEAILGRTRLSTKTKTGDGSGMVPGVPNNFH
jgi:hypothetical protein